MPVRRRSTGHRRRTEALAEPGNHREGEGRRRRSQHHPRSCGSLAPSLAPARARAAPGLCCYNGCPHLPSECRPEEAAFTLPVDLHPGLEKSRMPSGRFRHQVCISGGFSRLHSAQTHGLQAPLPWDVWVPVVRKAGCPPLLGCPCRSDTEPRSGQVGPGCRGAAGWGPWGHGCCSSCSVTPLSTAHGT